MWLARGNCRWLKKTRSCSRRGHRAKGGIPVCPRVRLFAGCGRGLEATTGGVQRQRDSIGQVPAGNHPVGGPAALRPNWILRDIVIAELTEALSASRHSRIENPRTGPWPRLGQAGTSAPEIRQFFTDLDPSATALARDTFDKNARAGTLIEDTRPPARHRLADDVGCRQAGQYGADVIQPWARAMVQLVHTRLLSWTRWRGRQFGRRLSRSACVYRKKTCAKHAATPSRLPPRRNRAGCAVQNIHHPPLPVRQTGRDQSIRPETLISTSRQMSSRSGSAAVRTGRRAKAADASASENGGNGRSTLAHAPCGGSVAISRGRDGAGLQEINPPDQCPPKGVDLQQQLEQGHPAHDPDQNANEKRIAGKLGQNGSRRSLCPMAFSMNGPATKRIQAESQAFLVLALYGGTGVDVHHSAGAVSQLI